MPKEPHLTDTHDEEDKRLTPAYPEARDKEAQLEEGLEDSFPASDPPSIVMPSEPKKPLVGTDEVLRRQKRKKQE